MPDTIQFQSEYIKLCEIGNLYDAADALYISESNLLKHMKSLEEEVNHKLFLKCATRVELTEYGSLYLSFAYRFKELDNELFAKTAEFDAKATSTVRLALTRTMNADHIVNMLSDHFAERHPEFSLFSKELSRTSTLDQIFSQGYDLVLSAGSSPNNSDYCTYQWSTDFLVAILPKNHRLANKKSLVLSDLANENFILFPEGSFLNSYALSICRKAGFEPSVDFTIHGTKNLAELVEAGIGVSLTTSSDIASIKQHEVAIVKLEPETKVYLNLYHRKNVPLTLPAKTFLDFALDIRDHHRSDIPFEGPEGKVEHIYFK